MGVATPDLFRGSQQRPHPIESLLPPPDQLSRAARLLLPPLKGEAAEHASPFTRCDNCRRGMTFQWLKSCASPRMSWGSTCDLNWINTQTTGRPSPILWGMCAVPDPASTRRKERFSGKPFPLRCPSSVDYDAPLLWNERSDVERGRHLQSKCRERHPPEPTAISDRRLRWMAVGEG